MRLVEGANKLPAAYKRCETASGVKEILRSINVLGSLGVPVGPTHHYIAAIHYGLTKQGMGEEEMMAFLAAAKEEIAAERAAANP